MSKREKLEGLRFGEWEALEYLGNRKYLCRCSCGKEKIVEGYSLKSGATKSCGHATSEFKDETGKTYGDLIVLGYEGNRMFRCRCSCGKEILVLGKYLRNGATKSCGHWKKDDLTGRVFGEWTVIEYSGNLRWKCRCSCGTVKDVLAQNLKNGRSTSCGCKAIEKRTESWKKHMISKYGELSGHRINNPREMWQVKAVSSREDMLDIIDKFILENNRIPKVIELCDMLDITYSALIKKIRQFDLADRVDLYGETSYKETQLADYITSIYNGEVVTNTRIVIYPKELDIYIPELGLAIEFNGTYWHSNERKSTSYHVDKSMQSGKAGVRLVHIFEYEWDNDTQREKIKYFLSDLINKDKRKVYGRETTVNIITDDESADFLNKYHLQGNAGASIKYGCYIDNELLGVMTFGKPRFNKDFEYELIRMCWKPGTLVIGGTEKLFNRFIRDYDPNNIICYCDAAKFVGSSYKKLGFKVDGLTTPNYVWVDYSNKDVLPRYRTMKQKLLDEGLGEYGETEDEIMENLGYLKIYDCGNIRYIWNKE